MTPVRWVVASVGVAVALLGIVLISALHTNTAFTPNPTKGRRAPSFALPALGGGSVSLAENAGKVTVLNFWNDWCIPCQSEQSDLNALWTAHKVDTAQQVVRVHPRRAVSVLTEPPRTHPVHWADWLITT